MSGLVDRAERRGLLERARNPADGRAVEVFMTAAGLQLADRLFGEIQQSLAEVTEHLDPAQRDTLTGLLEHLLGPPPG